MVEDAANHDPLEDWEEGSAFGVSEDKDPACTVPVEEWVLELPIESTIDVPIPDRLVDQVIGQDAASIVIRKAAEQRRHVIMAVSYTHLTLPTT